jgi:hypothetical protein
VELLNALKVALMGVFNEQMIMELLQAVVFTLVSWGGLRLINLSKRNSKYAIAWMLVKQAARLTLSGEDKKAWVKVRFHALCHNTWLKKIFGVVSDAALDLWIENLYLKLAEQGMDFPATPLDSK